MEEKEKGREGSDAVFSFLHFHLHQSAAAVATAGVVVNGARKWKSAANEPKGEMEDANFPSAFPSTLSQPIAHPNRPFTEAATRLKTFAL